jgi:hypothetical protein
MHRYPLRKLRGTGEEWYQYAMGVSDCIGESAVSPLNVSAPMICNGCHVFRLQQVKDERHMHLFMTTHSENCVAIARLGFTPVPQRACRERE